MNKTRLLAILTAGLCTGATGLHGQLVVNYTFASSLSAASTAANVTASAVGGVTSGANAIAYSSGKGINADGSSYVGGNPIDNTLETNWSGANGRAFGRSFWPTTANDMGTDFRHYFSWSVTVSSGSIDFGSGSNIQVDLGTRQFGPSNYAIAYSADGFASQTFIAGGLTPSSSPSMVVGTGLPGNQQFDWKRVSHTFTAGTINSGTTLSFRIYMAGPGTNTTSEANGYLDNLTVTAVPEPSTFALLGGCCALGFVLWRRRRLAMA